MTTSQLFNEITQSADLLALAIVRRMNPSDDLITQTKAFKEYGKGWIEKNTEPAGVLRTFRKGSAANSKVLYSRMEIAALIETERQQHQRIMQDMSNNK